MLSVPSGRRCAVIGAPVAHSLSPAMHRAAYAHLGLDWSYDAVEVTEAALPGFLADCGPEVRGLSMTMPLKHAPVRLAGDPGLLRGRDGTVRALVLDPSADRVGAVNTAVFGTGDIVFHNTDVAGVAGALRAAGITDPAEATVLGAGGTARAAVVALLDLGCRHLTVLARTPARAEPLRVFAAAHGAVLTIDRFTPAAVPVTALTVATVVAAAADPLASAVAERSAAVFEVLYDPWPTELARAARRAGRVLVGGLDLLAHQAAGQVRLMTGHDIEPEVLLAAGRQSLERRQAARGAMED